MVAFSSLQNFVVGWGIPKQLCLDLLPTGGDLVDHYFFPEHTVQPTMSKWDMLKSICRSITDLWMEAGATPIGSTGVEKRSTSSLRIYEVSRRHHPGNVTERSFSG